MEWYKEINPNNQGIFISGGDALTQGGFTSVPNVLLHATTFGSSPKMSYISLLFTSKFEPSCASRQEELANIVNQSKATINKNLKTLSENNFITPHKKGNGRPTVYELHAKVIRKDEKRKKTLTELDRELAALFEGADDFTRYGWTKLPNAIVTSPLLLDGEKITYTLLLMLAFGKEECQVRQTYLAERIGVRREIVSRYLRSLEKQELIEIIQSGNMKLNRYVLNINKAVSNHSKKVDSNKNSKRQHINLKITELGIELLSKDFAGYGSQDNLRFQVMKGKSSMQIAFRVSDDIGDSIIEAETSNNKIIIPIDILSEKVLGNIFEYKGSYAAYSRSEIKINSIPTQGDWYSFLLEK